MNASIAPTVPIERVAPFRCSPERLTDSATTVSGEVPDWLRGEVVRTCPAVFETLGWRAEHWFDALGMIYAFRIESSGILFRSRLLDSETARDAWQGKAHLGSFGTPTRRSLMGRAFHPISRISDNTNVNIARIGDELVAMTEGDRQHVIDGDTLASIGTVSYLKDAVNGGIMSAHPHFDFERGKVVNVATGFGRGGVVSLYEHAPADRRRDVVGSWSTDRVPYIHTFGLTSKHGILVAQPFTVTPLKMLWSKKGYIDHFDWRPAEGTRLVLIDRSTGAIREHSTDALFMFHTVNAFERDDETILDLLAYTNADIMSSLRTERMVSRLPQLTPSLVRITMRHGSDRATAEKLSEKGFEFPSTNYRLVNGHPYRFAYGASDGYDSGGTYTSAVTKVSVETGQSISFSDGRHIFGEPLFVAKPGSDREDDGVLLTVGSNLETESSILAIIDANSMALIASAQVPLSIPLGFHGSFLWGKGT